MTAEIYRREEKIKESNLNDDLNKYRFSGPVIDNHCHLYFPEDLHTSLTEYEAQIEEYGLERLAMLSCPLSGHAGDGVDVWENFKMLYMKARLPIKTYAYFGFNTHSDDPEQYLLAAREALAMGFDGFKSLEMMPHIRKSLGFGLDDARYDRFFDFWEASGRPAVLHVGNPRVNWSDKVSEYARTHGRAYDETYPTLDSLYDEMDRRLNKNPGLKIIFAHFYFMYDRIERLEKLLTDFPGVYLDLTPGGEMFPAFSENIPLWREFFLRFQKRILLGSDHYAREMGRTRYHLVREALEGNEPFLMYKTEPVLPLHLPEEALENIYRRNVLDLCGEPRKLDRERVAHALRTSDISVRTEIEKTNRETLLAYFA